MPSLAKSKYIFTPRSIGADRLAKVYTDRIKDRKIKLLSFSFIHQFGKTLNYHPHFHIIVADGLFSTDYDDLLFHELALTPDDIVDTEDGIRKVTV